MKSVAASVFLAGLAVAGPLFDKRALQVQEVVETVWVTTTVWVDPTGGPKAQFHEVPVKSSAVLNPNLFSGFAGPSSAPAAKSEAPTTTVAVVPTTEAVAPPPAPTTTTQQAVETPKVQAAAAGSKGSFSGDFTFYDPADGGGQVSCGGYYNSTSQIAALGKGAMGYASNPNANPNCGRLINIWANGVGPFQVTAVDTCGGCPNDNDIDVTSTVFEKFAPLSVGRLKMGASNGMTWAWA